MADYLSVFIAALAFFISIWSVVTSRKHNRLSVRPHMKIYEYFFLDWSGIYISNMGLGPAIIKSFILIIDGKEVIDVNDFPKKPLGIWNTAFTKLGFKEDMKPLALLSYKVGEAIPNGEPIRLVELSMEKQPSNDEYLRKQELLRSALKHFEIKIKYTSMYGEKPWNCDWPK